MPPGLYLLSPRCFCETPRLSKEMHRLDGRQRGWVGARWQRRCKTSLSLRELGNQGIVFLFGAHCVFFVLR